MGLSIRYARGMKKSDKLFNEKTGVVINDIPLTDEAHESFRNMFIMQVEGDIEITPTCMCGELKAPLYLDVAKCPKCNTSPSDSRGELKPLVALRTPRGISTLICVNLWNTMRDAFNRGGASGISFLQWVTDPTYSPKLDNTARQIIADMEKKGIKRGYNNFVDNLVRYVRIMSTVSKFSSRESVKNLLKLLEMESPYIFRNDYIPFMDNITRILEKSDRNRRAATGFSSVLDAVFGMLSIDDPMYDDVREVKVAQFMQKYSLYWDKFLTNTVQGKHKYIRGTLFASRGVRIARLVASSMSEPHDINSIKIPWIAMINTLETPITSILLKKGFTYSDIKEFIQHCSVNYNKTMDNILKKLVRDGTFLSVAMQRYPTLTRGNMLWMKDVLYDTNPKNYVVAVSPLIVRPLNLDYDGDMLHVSIWCDLVMAYVLEKLAFHYNGLDPIQARTLKNIEMTVPMDNNLLMWMEKDDRLNPTKEQVQNMIDKVGC